MVDVPKQMSFAPWCVELILLSFQLLQLASDYLFVVQRAVFKIEEKHRTETSDETASREQNYGDVEDDVGSCFLYIGIDDDGKQEEGQGGQHDRYIAQHCDSSKEWFVFLMWLIDEFFFDDAIGYLFSLVPLRTKVLNSLGVMTELRYF